MESVPELADLPAIFISAYSRETIAAAAAPTEATDPPDASQFALDLQNLARPIRATNVHTY